MTNSQAAKRLLTLPRAAKRAGPRKARHAPPKRLQGRARPMNRKGSPRTRHEVRAVAMPITSPPARRATVLLAEEHEKMRELLGRILESSGYRVIPVSNDAEAASAAKRHSEPIPLLLGETRTAALQWTHLRETLKQRHPEMSALLLSDYPDVVVEPDAALLTRPFTPAALLDRVREVLRGDPHPRPASSGSARALTPILLRAS
jgi:CheY-like chemotaxis protein